MPGAFFCLSVCCLFAIITLMAISFPLVSACREITTDDEFLALCGPWNALLNRCDYPTPFCSWAWAWEWWQKFGGAAAPGYRLLVAQVYDTAGRLVGLAPFFFPGDGAGPLRLRPLRPLATRIHCLVDDLTEEPLILLDADAPEAVFAALCQALLAWPGRADWDLIHLRLLRRAGTSEIGPQWRRLPGAFPFVLTRRRRRLGQTRCLPPAWPALRRSLSKSMRDNTSYYPRLLTREGHEWSVTICRDPEAVSRAVRLLIRLHECRAQSGHGPAHTNHLPGAAQQAFLHDILTRLAGAGMAAVALLEVDREVVAAQSVLECAGRLTFYYSGFDPRWHRYSPVTLLHTALIQDAQARGLTALDYLPEAEPWKTRWGTEAEWVYDELSCLSLSPRSLLRSGWRDVTRLLSRWRGSDCECGFCTPEERRAART